MKSRYRNSTELDTTQIVGTHEGSLAKLEFLNIVKTELGECLEGAGFKFYSSYFFQVQIFQLPQIPEGVNSELDATIAVCYVEITDHVKLHAEVCLTEVEAL